MMQNNYIVLGKTKMVDMDFSVLYPSTSYFVNVNMLVEFSTMGQVIPTRIDVLPYKLSAFAEFNPDATKTIDVLKMLLVLYTCYAVLVNICGQKSIQNIFRLRNIWDNFVDLTIIYL